MKTQDLKIDHAILFAGLTNYTDSEKLYYSYFNKLPNVKSISEINITKLWRWLSIEWKGRIIQEHSRQEYDREKKQIKHVDLIYVLENNIMVTLKGNTVTILHGIEQSEIAREYIFLFKKFTKLTRKTQSINLVIQIDGELRTSSIKIKKPALNLAKNYNDDLLPMHNKVMSILNQKERSGLYLFHGIPGTGKSTYIRFLIRSINKRVIFMPPGLAGNMDSPNVANLLLRNRNSVFVIEDAEELLSSRDAGRNSSISMLLNLTDGLLGETLGIQIICTFNTNLQNIDKALLRKGRLLALYDFKPLAVNKAKILLNEIGVPDYPVSQAMTLANIFNTEDELYIHKNDNRPQIGFLSNAV